LKAYYFDHRILPLSLLSSSSVQHPTSLSALLCPTFGLFLSVKRKIMNLRSPSRLVSPF